MEKQVMTSKSKKLVFKPDNLSPSSHTLEENNNSRPSVPIYIYRQLVQELEKAKADLEILKSQNQALVAHNEELKQEVSQIFHTAQNLQAILNKKDSIVEVEKKSKSTSKGKKISIKTEKGFSHILFSKEVSPTEIPLLKSDPQKHILEVDLKKSHSSQNLSKNREINSLWLIITLISIIFLTCFFGSIFVVSFLINNNSNSN